jgi:hypothetical protein
MPKKAAEHFDLAVFSMETSRQTRTVPYLNALLNLFGSRQASCIWEGTDRLVEKIKATFIDVCGKDTGNPQLPGRCGRTINVGPADLLRYPLDLHYTTRVAQTWADRASMIAGSFQGLFRRSGKKNGEGRNGRILITTSSFSLLEVKGSNSLSTLSPYSWYTCLPGRSHT